MAYGLLDDGFAEHPKIVGLSDAAFRAHVEVLCFCFRTLSDGRVPVRVTERYRPTVVGELITAGLWERNEQTHYCIHDYLDHNPSREEVLQRRSDAKKRKERWRERVTERVTDTHPTPTPTPTPKPTPKKEVPVPSEPRPAGAGPTDAVLAHYRSFHPRARPGDKERRLIQARLKDGWSAEDLCGAIDGNHRDPHCCGQNDRGTVYHDLGLIFRDSSHVQRYLDVPTNGHVPSERLQKAARVGDNWLAMKESKDEKA